MSTIFRFYLAGEDSEQIVQIFYKIYLCTASCVLYMHTHTHTHKHTHKHMHTYTHTHAHAHAHTVTNIIIKNK